MLRNTMEVDTKFMQCTLSSVVCDKPARASIWQLMRVTSYFGCDRCIKRVLYFDERVIFLWIRCKTRDNRSFRTVWPQSLCLPTHGRDIHFSVGLYAPRVLRYYEQVACIVVTWPCHESLSFKSVRRRNPWWAYSCLQRWHILWLSTVMLACWWRRLFGSHGDSHVFIACWTRMFEGLTPWWCVRAFHFVVCVRLYFMSPLCI